MDNGADRIAQDIKDIVQTRVAIAEKLGAIEQHVGTTMQHARTTMTQVADKTTSTVCDTMQAAKQVFDLRIHATRHPWMFVGGTLILGYGVGALYRRGWRLTNGVVPYYPRGAKAAPVMPVSPTSQQHKSGVYPFYPPRESDNHEAGRAPGAEQEQANRPTVWAELEGAFQDELGVVRNNFIRFGRGLLHEMVRQAVPALVQIISGNRRERSSRSASDSEYR